MPTATTAELQAFGHAARLVLAWKPVALPPLAQARARSRAGAGNPGAARGYLSSARRAGCPSAQAPPRSRSMHARRHALTAWPPGPASRPSGRSAHRRCKRGKMYMLRQQRPCKSCVAARAAHGRGWWRLSCMSCTSTHRRVARRPCAPASSASPTAAWCRRGRRSGAADGGTADACAANTGTASGDDNGP
ncbi:hypothetical protein D9M70_360240 [compost metagenome]